MFFCNISWPAFNEWLTIIFSDILLVADIDDFLCKCVSPESFPIRLLKVYIFCLFRWGCVVYSRHGTCSMG